MAARAGEFCQVQRRRKKRPAAEMVAGIDLSAPACAGLNSKLGAALEQRDAQALRDILETLDASDAAGKLKNLASSKLAKAVQKLESHEDGGIAASASSLVKRWRALAKTTNARPKAEADGEPAAAPSQPCLLYTSPSPRDGLLSRMPSSA